MIVREVNFISSTPTRVPNILFTLRTILSTLMASINEKSLGLEIMYLMLNKTDLLQPASFTDPLQAHINQTRSPIR